MSSIAERIKQKLEAFEHYTYEEPEVNMSYGSESEEERKINIEPLIIENNKRNSVGLIEPNDEFIKKYLSEKNIELIENSQSCKNFAVEKNAEKNYLFPEKDLNYKINEYVTNKLNEQGLLSPSSKRKNSKNPSLKNNSFLINKPANLKLNFINNNNNINYNTNYSTDHTQNIDSNGKQSNFNYIELGNTCEESFDYGEESINTQSENSVNVFNTLKQDEKGSLSKKASGSAESKKPDVQRNSNYNESNNNFTLRKITSFGNKESTEKEESIRDFNEIQLNEPESFFYQIFEENSNNDYKNYNYNSQKGNCLKNAVEESDRTVNTNNSICRKIFMPTYYFLEEFVFVFLMLLLLILDPIIILALKSIDFTYERLNKCCNSKNKYSKIDNFNINIGNNNNNHLLFCGEIEEIDINILENFENPNYDIRQTSSLYEKYFNYFFNNCVYKKQRIIIKTCFIVVALILNIYILSNIQGKTTKLLLFFLNNLYLLYHTMDLYNEKLLSYTENLGWSKIMNRI